MPAPLILDYAPVRSDPFRRFFRAALRYTSFFLLGACIVSGPSYFAIKPTYRSSGFLKVIPRPQSETVSYGTTVIAASSLSSPLVIEITLMQPTWDWVGIPLKSERRAKLRDVIRLEFSVPGKPIEIIAEADDPRMAMACVEALQVAAQKASRWPDAQPDWSGGTSYLCKARSPRLGVMTHRKTIQCAFAGTIGGVLAVMVYRRWQTQRGFI